MPLTRIKTVLHFCFVLILLGGFTACREAKEPTAEFRNAYIEMRVVAEIYGARKEASLLQQHTLEKYGFTASSFAKEAERLRGDYKLWLGFQSEVVATIDSILEKKKKKK